MKRQFTGFQNSGIWRALLLDQEGYDRQIKFMQQAAAFKSILNRYDKNKGTTDDADYLPYNEYMRLLECLREKKLYIWELYCRLGFCTALRCCDILTLKWRDILDKQQLIKIEQKKPIKPD